MNKAKIIAIVSSITAAFAIVVGASLLAVHHKNVKIEDLNTQFRKAQLESEQEIGRMNAVHERDVQVISSFKRELDQLNAERAAGRYDIFSRENVERVLAASNKNLQESVRLRAENDRMRIAHADDVREIERLQAAHSKEQAEHTREIERLQAAHSKEQAEHTQEIAKLREALIRETEQSSYFESHSLYLDSEVGRLDSVVDRLKTELRRVKAAR